MRTCLTTRGGRSPCRRLPWSPDPSSRSGVASPTFGFAWLRDQAYVAAIDDALSDLANGRVAGPASKPPWLDGADTALGAACRRFSTSGTPAAARAAASPTNV